MVVTDGARHCQLTTQHPHAAHVAAAGLRGELVVGSREGEAVGAVRRRLLQPYPPPSQPRCGGGCFSPARHHHSHNARLYPPPPHLDALLFTGLLRLVVAAELHSLAGAAQHGTAIACVCDIEGVALHHGCERCRAGALARLFADLGIVQLVDLHKRVGLWVAAAGAGGAAASR